MGVGSSASMGWGALLGFGEETAWGTRVTATSFMEFRSTGLKKTIDSELLSSLGTGRAKARRVQKAIGVDGPISWDLHPVDGIKLLKHALMGTVTSAQVGVTVAYNHTFTAGDISGIAQKGLSFEVRPSSDTTTAWNFIGCRVNTLRLSGSINQPVRAEMTFIGRDATTVAFATTTVAYSSVRPFLFQDSTFIIDGTPGSLTTTSLENVIAFDLTINNNLQADDSARSLGSQLLSALPPGPRDISLRITQRFDTTTAWDRFRQGTQATIRFRFDTGITIGAAATTYAMFIDLNKINYDAYNMGINGPGIVTYDCDLSAISDTTTNTGTDIIATLTNSVTTYA